MRKVFGPLAILAGAMFVASPFVIASAPFESSMGIVSKIFYFHVPSWFAIFTAIAVCGLASLIHLFKTSPKADRIAEALLVPMVALMFQAALFSRPLLLAGLLAGGTIGFCAVGTLFAAMLVRACSRDVLLPILLYPIIIPVIIAGVRGTAALLTATPDEPTAIMWLGILGAFDTVFLTLALWTFEPLMTE